MRFFATATLLAVAVILVRCTTYTTIKADVVAIGTNVTALKAQLASNTITYGSALAINSAAQALDTQVKKGTSDVGNNTVAITDAQAKVLIQSLTATELNVKNCTTRLIALKPKFDSLGVSGLAKTDIDNLATDTKAFGTALLNATPSAEKKSATALLAKFNADLAAAVKAYAKS